jgi:hypothetical protein
MRAWSFSALNAYRTCAKQYYHYKILKDVPEPQGEEMKWGNRVHNAMADRIAKAQPLPSEMAGYEKWIEWALVNSDRSEVELGVERKMAITEGFDPCEYFDKQVPVWFRTVLDVVKVRVKDGVARIIDWKTGKFPKDALAEAEAMQQLSLSATVIFATYPAVQHAQLQLVYLKDSDKIERTFSRPDLPREWQQIMPILAQMEASEKQLEYPANPSGLCKKHCAVTSCVFHGRGSF